MTRKFCSLTLILILLSLSNVNRQETTAIKAGKIMVDDMVIFTQ